MSAALGWREVALTSRAHRTGLTLALTAPPQTLLTATSVNEWALHAAAAELALAFDPASLEDDAPPLEERAALATLRERAATEAALIAAGGPDAPETPLPPASIPVALVTGSNGKTTTVRLVAAMLRASGHVVGYSCTDGVFVGDEQLVSGDFSGPEGARRVLGDSRVTAAVLETARGGLLRRGLVVPRADAAVITNVAADHFGDYGVDSLADLAQVKSVVARALGANGVLVLNEEDESLRALRSLLSAATAARVEWFRTSPPDPLLPPTNEIPIALGGAARYNLANATAAAHAALALGVSRELIAATLRTFGANNADNAGRLERFERAGVRVWIDYAHNPHGLSALLDAALVQRGKGRLGLLLGQAGDRDDDAIRALARVAFAAGPDRIVIKEIDGYLRGRAPGEVPALLRDQLSASGARDDQLSLAADDVAGVRDLLAWARPGDLIVLPVHALESRKRAIALVTEPG